MKSFRQGHSTAVHPPFPESSGEAYDLYVMAAMFLISLRPGLVRAAAEWFNNEDFQILFMLMRLI